MYELNDDQFKVLQEVYAHIDGLTITGSQNFILAANASVKLRTILEDISKQIIKIDNTKKGVVM